MKVNLSGRVALVGASSQGMGFASAELLLDSGCQVVICARSEDKLQAAAEKLKKTRKDDVLAVQADVSRADDVDRVAKAALEKFGKIDILVNNAGGPKPGAIEALTDEDWLAAMNLNFLSAVRFTRWALPSMKANKWGRIINITSILAKSPSEGMALSNSMRAAVLGFAKTLSREAGPFGVTVNSLCPGATQTERFNRLLAGDAKDENISVEAMAEKVRASLPTRFIGQPKDFANMVLFLASEEARYVNGTTIQIDGGEYKGLV
jgi:3-oxoacyl-[acyl-carrier protein] reductase